MKKVKQKFSSLLTAAILLCTTAVIPLPAQAANAGQAIDVFLGQGLIGNSGHDAADIFNNFNAGVSGFSKSSNAKVNGNSISMDDPDKSATFTVNINSNELLKQLVKSSTAEYCVTGWVKSDGGAYHATIPGHKDYERGYIKVSDSRGYSKDESVLTILTGGWSHCGNYMLKPNLDEFYAAVKTFELLHGVTILVSPLRAKELEEQEGCHTRKDIEEYFWNHITMSIGELKRIGIYDRLIVPDYKSGTHEWDPSVISLPDDAIIPVFPRKQINVIVVGDPKGSNVVQGWSQCNPHSASIDKWR